jgi:hypothetical protein
MSFRAAGVPVGPAVVVLLPVSTLWGVEGAGVDAWVVGALLVVGAAVGAWEVGVGVGEGAALP